MNIEEKYLKEYGNQVQKYIDTFGLVEEDLGKLTNSTSTNIKNITKGKVGLNIKKMISIATVFGVTHYHFSNPKSTLPSLKQLPKITQEKIAERQEKGIIDRDQENLFSNKLDKLIKQGHFDTPTTSKLTLDKMGKEFNDKNSSEITTLLGRSPRNKIIKSIGKHNKQIIYVHMDHAEKFEKLSEEELSKIILDQES